MEEKKAIKTILILVANPRNNSQRGLKFSQRSLEVEVREINEGLMLGKKCERFRLEQEWAVNPDGLRRAMLRFQPQIVHFCGYGFASEGIALEHKNGGVHLVSTDALSNLFKLFSNQVECVLLSACYSELQAQAISEHISYVVGMHRDISHKAAIKFATGFYDALGAGRSYEDSFQFGCNSIELYSIPEDSTPVFKKKLIKVEKDFMAPTILILEDDEKWLSQHELRLKRAGLNCHSTQLAEEAIRIAKIDSSIKFAIIDEILFMPPISRDPRQRQPQRWQGSGVIREIRHLRPDIKFIFVTSAPELRSEGSSQIFRRETKKLKLLPSVIDVFHQQDIEEDPNTVYEKLIKLLFTIQPSTSHYTTITETKI